LGLKPYTDFEFERLPKEGIKALGCNYACLCSDCFETFGRKLPWKEKHQFQEAGGKDYKQYTPCLNDNEAW